MNKSAALRLLDKLTNRGYIHTERGVFLEAEYPDVDDLRTLIQQDAQTIAERDLTITQQAKDIETYHKPLHERDLTQINEQNRTIETLRQELTDARRCIKGWEEGNIEWQKVQAENDVLKRERDEAYRNIKVLQDAAQTTYNSREEWERAFYEVCSQRDAIKRELDQERRIRDNRANRVRQVAMSSKRWFLNERDWSALLTEAAQPAADEAPAPADEHLDVTGIPQLKCGDLHDRDLAQINRQNKEIAKVTQERDGLIAQYNEYRRLTAQTEKDLKAVEAERDDLKGRLEGLVKFVRVFNNGPHYPSLEAACAKAESLTSPKEE